MTWKLWVDDQLDDPETPNRHPLEGFVGAKSTEEAKALVLERGLPSFMDLDHDLGGDDKVMMFLRWLAREYPDGPIPEVKVHSENWEGVKNIVAFIGSWKRSLE